MRFGKSKKTGRGLAVKILAFPLVCGGFEMEEAQKWMSGVWDSYGNLRRTDGRTPGQVRQAVKNGFLPEQMDALGSAGCAISAKDYGFLRPLNGIYSKWIEDVVTIHNVFKPFRQLMPECYYQICKRDFQTQVIPMQSGTEDGALADVVELLRSRGRLTLRRSDKSACWQLVYQDGRFRFDGEETDEAGLLRRLSEMDGMLVVMEYIAVPADLKLTVFNEHGDDPVIGDAVCCRDGKICAANGKDIPCWDEIRETADRLCRFVPQLEFFGLDILLTEEGFRILDIVDHPEYPCRIPFSQATAAFLVKKRDQKKAAYPFAKAVRNGLAVLKPRVLSVFSNLFLPRDLNSISWLRSQKKDFLTNKDTTRQEKLWAFRHGFLSYRLHQYGITPENWKDYISDLEYGWLRHINNKYRGWMEDKITVKYICSQHNRCFPEYYYHISLKNGKNKVLPMMDCPEGYGASYEDILRLVKEKRYLALKPDEGSHGNGFYKLTYYDGKYYLNHKEAAEQDVLDILQNEKNQYLVTEYIDMHPEIKRIYPGAVNTIRMIVFKKDGKTPRIGNAYMRIGSARTGAVDNMGAGGMYARIDVDTGRFYDAKIMEANEIKPCPYHPDTHERIEGYLPNWETVKQQVLEVAKDIRQLEYFGFDVALTPDGLKFPEINRFPDYPAIEQYSPATVDYLLYKLEVKKKKYGYDVHRGHTLLKLPDRS